MNCRNLDKLWIPYLDGKASAEERKLLEAHLAECVECALRREEMESVSAMLGAWEAPEPSPWFDARLRARIAEQPARGWMARWLTVASPASPIAIAAMILLAVLLVMPGDHSAPLAPGVTEVSEARLDDVPLEEVLHAADEMDLLNDFEMLSELRPPSEIRNMERQRGR